MGFVYYGNYPLYYEEGRTDLIRSLGWPYSKMEKEGIALPVLSLNSKYIKPAFYDDILTIKTYLKKLPSVKIEFDYEVYNEEGELLNVGNTVLAFVNTETKKPEEGPRAFIEEVKKRL